jgi:AraC-like DNA-binding protein
MRVFATETVDECRRIDYWNELASDSLVPMRISVRGNPSRFHGRLWAEQLAGITVIGARSSPVVIQRARFDMAQARQRMFLLHVAEEGSYHVRRPGCEFDVKPGDLLFSDSAESSEWVHGGCSVIIFVIPEDLLKVHLPIADDVLPLVVSGSRGTGAVASAMIQAVVRNLRFGMVPAAAEHLCAGLLNVTAAAFCECLGALPPCAVTRGARRAEIVRYVDAHLAEGDLTVANVATVFGLSDRYVRSLFEEDGEALSTYIQRRRLEGSARQLRDPMWRVRTVSAIAFDWGFNSLASYDRAFKARFDISPGEYRARSVASNASVVSDD